jgi:hypothetical protein
MAAEPMMKLGAIARCSDELEERGGLEGVDIAKISTDAGQP